MSTTATTAERNPEDVMAKQLAARKVMQQLLALTANFLAHAEQLDSLQSPQGEPDGDLETLPTDFRNSWIYEYRLQAVWEEALSAIRRVGELVSFCSLRDFPVEEEVSLILDKQIVLEQFVADRIEAMVQSADKAHAAELRHALESVTNRIAKLEEKQKEYPKAPFRPNYSDLQADTEWHLAAFGRPYEDRANPEETDDSDAAADQTAAT
jgi:hypothetical protein